MEVSRLRSGRLSEKKNLPNNFINVRSLSAQGNLTQMFCLTRHDGTCLS